MGPKCLTRVLQLSLVALPMQFTVITPAFNCAPFIERNIHSVQEQGLGEEALEHWVIDGGSTDGTQEVLQKYPHLKWISEPDKGLSDAVNKGIERARGEWLIWLNADDYLVPGALKAFQGYVAEHPEARLVCGDISLRGYEGEEEQYIPAWEYTYQNLLDNVHGINQQSTFMHREVFEKVGGMDVKNRHTMDWEWMVRAVREFPCHTFPHLLACYQRRRGSIIDGEGLLAQYRDFIRIRREHGAPVWSLAELRLRSYIWTHPFRRVAWLRRGVRTIKSWVGRKPLHPMQGD